MIERSCQSQNDETIDQLVDQQKMSHLCWRWINSFIFQAKTQNVLRFWRWQFWLRKSWLPTDCENNIIKIKRLRSCILFRNEALIFMCLFPADPSTWQGVNTKHVKAELHSSSGSVHTLLGNVECYKHFNCKIPCSEREHSTSQKKKTKQSWSLS